MAHFSPNFIKFFDDLSENNNSLWFNENRKIYEKEVKKPFSDLVAELIERIKLYQPEIMIKPSDAIFRINNDLRFSKEKIPYKTYVSAIISPKGKKDKLAPGLYFQISSRELTVFGGAYMLETATLLKLRKAIANDLEHFAELYHNGDFKSTYNEILGDKHKRLSDPFLKKKAEQEPLLFNKQFYFMAKLQSELILSSELPEKIIECYLAGKPMNEYLYAAMLE